MSAHTKGPWRVHRTADSADQVFITNGPRNGSVPVAQALFTLSLQTPEERDANARLIASAPALLALVRQLAAIDLDEIYDGDLRHAPDEIIDAVDAAIKMVRRLDGE